MTKSKKPTKPTPTGRDKTMLFSADWCAPCKQLKRALDRNPELASEVEIIDVDVQVALADQFGVQTIPTLIRPDGNRLEGLPTLGELRAFMRGGAR